MKDQEIIPKQYERANYDQSVNVLENFQEKIIEVLAIVDSNLWYVVVVCLSDRYIGKCMVKSNSVGLHSSLDLVISYNKAQQNVYCIAYLKGSLV